MSKFGKAGLFVGLLGVFLVLIAFNAFAHVRSTFADRLYGGSRPLEDILIVRIDDPSIRAIGRWPWSRDIEAELLDKVADARVIGMDVSFLEPSEGDDRLAKTLEHMPNVVLAAESVGGRVHAPIFPAPYGVVNLIGDADGVTRRFDPSTGAMPFALALAARLGVTAPALNGPALINFIGPPGTFASVSAKDVLAGDATCAGRIVLIGATAPDLHDEYFVPTSNGTAMPGVEIHATILQNAILHRFLRAQGRLGLGVVAMLTAALGMFVLARVRIFYTIPLVLALLAVYGVSAILLFTHHQFVIDLFFAPLALLAFTGAGIGVHYVDEKRKGVYLRTAFSKYVSRELLAELLARKQQLTLGGEKKIVTVFFSDIRDFTTICETLPPEALVQLLNEYLTAMTGVILRHQGTVDKFVGDAIMALWNAPLTDEQHAFKACATALEQIRTIDTLQRGWAERGVPVLKIGIGINTGPAVVGNMGSEERFDYTAIGDTINLAARLESLTKLYGVSAIISEQTHALVKEQVACCRLDRVRVKGRQDAIVLYRLCVDEEPSFVAACDAALEQYFQGAFVEALQGFRTAHEIRADRACALFIDRCEAFVKDPPKDWDGVFYQA